ncbi:cytochrome b [soil metagenome]
MQTIEKGHDMNDDTPLHTTSQVIDPGQGAAGWRNSASRYGSLSVGLHWVMLLLIAAVYACIELRGNFPKGSDIREGLKTWHFMLGLAVLTLVIVRLAAHFSGPAPRIEPVAPTWQRRLATLMHVALYVLMIGMPLLGWLTLSAEGKSIPFFGLQLPPLVAESEALADWVQEIHETGGTIGYFLIGLHAAAALFHHYIVRDNTLRRMLPERDAAR